MKKVIIVGAGLAGSEAAWQAAKQGAEVTLYEMRPAKSTPAHKTAGFAELVCTARALPNWFAPIRSEATS